METIRKIRASHCLPIAVVGASRGARLVRWSARGNGLIAFAALVACYLLPGMIGHDPWKQDETYIADIVRNMLDSGDWMVPTMAGAPFMEKPPLFYWVAALCVRMSSPFLAPHDAARLATTLFLVGTCIATAIAVRACWDGRHAKVGVLVLLSCLGLERYAHLMLTDFAMLFGFGVAICGLLRSARYGQHAGLILGTGAGIAFMGKGLLGPGVLACSALMLPLLFVQWRRRSYLRELWMGCLAALPWLTIWPMLLLGRSPELLKEWIWANNIGRFLGFSVAELGAAHPPWFWIENLPWIALPGWPLALLTLWRRRGGAMNDPAIQLALTLCAVLLLVLGCSASARDNYALPILLPLALLAAPAAESLPSTLDRWWACGACALFGTMTIAVWTGWTSMMATGSVPDWPIVANYLPSQFHPVFDAWRFAAALAATAIPLWLAASARVFRGYGLRCWFVGLSVTWASFAILWGPWIDAAKSYRSVFESVREALPPGVKCLSQSGLGESELAMLHYYLGMTATRASSRHCGALLVEGPATRTPSVEAGGAQRLVWSGARPGDEDERFWLIVERRTKPVGDLTTRR
ncbi:hypothetical protein Q4S45_08570 [Massilia sp. R2A-15]|uniref:ArnT family glycosyltransferase n=1 Tax=Massilia sp. R2A-15 TaxID=3064278 RepID=UPI0027328887|nr:hypothetical protein [Massilia sp. R2A-15]WLI91158.1 hypothetical protein Q4S45_08570 [Massilia sp. R2A-15]